MTNELFDALTAKAEALVKARIQGHRKGLPEQPNYLHSYRVRDAVAARQPVDQPDREVVLAALLHDIVEDGDVSLVDLREMGFSERTVALVDLCSHRVEVVGNTERWVLMIARLVTSRDGDAWRIKIADLTDNLTHCRGLSPENRRFMVEAKASLMLRLTAGYEGLAGDREGLEEEARKQRGEMEGGE